jgi:hypothetical protein
VVTVSPRRGKYDLIDELRASLAYVTEKRAKEAAMADDKTTALVRSTNGIAVDELQRLALMLSKSSLLPDALRGKEADIAVTVMALSLIHI